MITAQGNAPSWEAAASPAQNRQGFAQGTAQAPAPDANITTQTPACASSDLAVLPSQEPTEM